MTQSIIALYRHHPECSQECCDGIVTALGNNYHIQYFDERDNLTEVLKSAKIVAFPGGIGEADKYYEFFKRKSANQIADFVEQGGYYLGICMGAYWAGPNYFDLLDGVDTVQYIKRPAADIKRSYATVAKVTWLNQSQKMFFYDGCALIGDESKFQTIARYANGDVMAIIQNRIGVIGCHLESQESWYEPTYRYIGQHWHYGQHHKLLLDFVNRLVGV